MRTFGYRLGIAWVTVGAACSTDTGAPTGDLLNQDLATVSADAAAQDVELMRGPGGGPFGLRLPGDPSQFECDSVTRESLTITRSCTFRDAGGSVQTAYDSLTTASATLHAEVDGPVDRGPWGGTVHRVRDLTVSGLAGSETQATWNGTGTGTSSKVRQTEDGATREYNVTESETISNVVVPVPRSDTAWPLSGSITTKMTVSITGGAEDGTTRTRDATITFNGTQYATVTVNGESFQFDLAQRGRCRRGTGHP